MTIDHVACYLVIDGMSYGVCEQLEDSLPRVGLSTVEGRGAIPIFESNMRTIFLGSVVKPSCNPLPLIHIIS